MRVVVRTPSRLHLGFLDLVGDLSRVYGGIGVAIDHPSVVLEARRHETLEVHGERSELVGETASRFLRHHGIRDGVRIDARQTIPEHVGLGSGTQLSLATAISLARLFAVDATVRETASLLGRGVFSGVGVAAFEKGGFIVEAGHRTRGGSPDETVHPEIPLVVGRYPFPEDWAFVAAIPGVGRGLREEEENPLLRALPLTTPGAAGRVCRFVLMEMLPSLLEHDIESFGRSLTEVQRASGDAFAGAQGGRFSSRVAEQLVNLMLEEGAHGAGQSSWGPTVYGLVEGEGKAERLRGAVEGFLRERTGGKVFVAHANNHGAEVTVSES